jgi:hypothetical protein
VSSYVDIDRMDVCPRCRKPDRWLYRVDDATSSIICGKCILKREANYDKAPPRDLNTCPNGHVGKYVKSPTTGWRKCGECHRLRSLAYAHGLKETA